MSRPATLFTGQWADLTLEVIAEKASKWGYDGIELPCWGDHFNVQKAVTEPSYCKGRHDLLGKHGLKCWAISNHLTGQLVLDHNDSRTDDWVPAAARGDSKKKTEWAIQEMKDSARAAQKLGVKVVNGFTGSKIWGWLYSFPPVSDAQIEDGFADFANRWNPILDEFKRCKVRFALEVHPTEIAFDTASAARALKAIGNRPEFGFNFDPSHLGYQGVDYIGFIRRFGDRIFHVHMKDVHWSKTPTEAGVFGGHTKFGDPRRFWDFRSLGRGSVDFEGIIRALNGVGYAGPLSVEWEDGGMDREHGAAESAAFLRRLEFPSSKVAFDAAFEKKKQPK